MALGVRVNVLVFEAVTLVVRVNVTVFEAAILVVTQMNRMTCSSYYVGQINIEKLLDNLQCANTFDTNNTTVYTTPLTPMLLIGAASLLHHRFGKIWSVGDPTTISENN